MQIMAITEKRHPSQIGQSNASSKTVSLLLAGVGLVTAE